tara:strand:- start:2106 stop:3404 length:1299 start_codon:yes stop_codon:yes gene_type:complete
MKTVYIGMTADTFHHGHINIISEARKYGKVIIGLLSDKALANHKRLPYLTWNQRKMILQNINGVHKIFKQDNWGYKEVILKYKPDFMVHGTDWLEGPLYPYRIEAIKALKSYGGKLVEIEYTKGVTSTAWSEHNKIIGTTSDVRRRSLKRLLASEKFIRIIEAHSPLSALIAENLSFHKNNKLVQFDGFWSSSLTDSTVLGKPDIEVLDINLRLGNINSIFEVTTKPLIMDGDTGGKIEHFELNVKSMERTGVSAVIIEDKKGLKKNSLLGNKVYQKQETIKDFCKKIIAGKKASLTNDFMIIARIESFILQKGLNDALKRAESYIKAGADGIMIHSKSKLPNEIFSFSKKFRKKYKKIPLICVPSTYNSVKEELLIKNGFNIVIYANHMLRASYPAMHNVAKSILKNSRSFEANQDIIKINEILKLIPGTI